MEYNRNRNFRRDNQPHPYDRGPPRGRGGNHAQRPDNFRSREGNFTSRGHFRSRDNQNWHHEKPYSRRNQGYWQNRPERTFDETGREVGRYESPSFYYNQEQTNVNAYSGNQRQQEDEQAKPMLTPMEIKAKDFLHTVLRQGGIRSKLIFLETVENSLQTLQGTVDYCQLQMTVEQNTTGEFVLKIDQEEVARGSFPNKQLAKSALAEQALDVLKKDCFYIVKKKIYEEVTAKKNEPKVETQTKASFEGSKAHQMMLKMGWGGKGLGVNEQGAEKTVAETLDQNVSRQGLGTDDVFKKIHKLLEDYSKSDKMSLLRFDPDFTSEERAHIHKMAAKFGLKSKSEGKGEQRRITITKKLHRSDLVYNLLTSDLENTLYKLVIPSKFELLWNDDEDDSDVIY